ncbi:MAG: T9SS type A sorting domain-containing protein [Flavobacteriales bacterium]|nr:T9SS type A sorting domain-containing protein [Flavobacteriales bacterium]
MKKILLFTVFFVFVSGLLKSQTYTYTTPGADTWTCPAGVTSVTVTVWGAGGGGGGCNSTADGGGGGGGGGCSQSVLAVTPGVTYNLYVGNGGAGGVGQNDGGDGEQSWFWSVATVMANGGIGGLRRDADGGEGGAGAVAGVGNTFTYTGGNGANGRNNNTGRGGGGGGGAGTTGNGGNASGSVTTYSITGGTGATVDGGNGGNGGNQANGVNGSNYGGGGGGAGEGTNRTGGDGAGGKVEIVVPAPVPDNDLCANAINLPCGALDTAGTTEGSTNVAPGTGCTVSNYGVWYTFTGDGNDNIIFVTPTDASFDVEMNIASGTCGSLTNIGCYDAGVAGEGEGALITTTLGTTYYVYVSYWSSAGTSSNTGPFNISRTCTNTNDLCTNAETLNCGETLFGSTYSATNTPHGTGCTMGDEGAWYTFMGDGIPTTILAMQYTAFDFEMAIVSGSCGSLTNVACVDLGTYAESYTFTPTNGVRYYIYIADYFSGGGLYGAFTITRSCGNPCGNDQTNDYCSDPALLYQGGGGWSSSTTDTYSPDLPANTQGLFCGSIENNSWYQFTAASTTETFDFTNVSNCALGVGIQAEVYQVTRDGSGCCTNLTSVSNCMSNGTTADATVTATGLTVGQQYILMVDGFAGDQCDFTVTGWTATGILPVELLEFNGVRVDNKTKLTWITETEINNDYFLVQKSSNGKNFIDLGTVQGNGNSNNQNYYEYYDETSSAKINYYRLKQFDFDGKYEFSKVIAVLNDDQPMTFTLYPNPAEDKLFVDLVNVPNQELTIKYINTLGSVITHRIEVDKSKTSYELPNFKDLDAGFYIIQIMDETSNVLTFEKVIKK